MPFPDGFLNDLFGIPKHEAFWNRTMLIRSSLGTRCGSLSQKAASNPSKEALESPQDQVHTSVMTCVLMREATASRNGSAKDGRTLLMFLP